MSALNAAQAWKYSADCVGLIEAEPGVFALFHFNRMGEPFYLGPWEGVCEAYRNRPVQLPRSGIRWDADEVERQKAKKVAHAGIDLSSLDFQL